MSTIDSFFAPFNDAVLLILRILVGAIFIVHGWMKANPAGSIGGGRGWSQMLRQMGLPGILATVVGYGHGLVETLGGLLVIVGLLTRLWVIFFAVIMLLAIFGAKISRGIPFMAGPDQGTGWEFDLILLGAALTLLVMGSGAISLDSLLGLPF